MRTQTYTQIGKHQHSNMKTNNSDGRPAETRRTTRRKRILNTTPGKREEGERNNKERRRSASLAKGSETETETASRGDKWRIQI
mmetsp:Transcript_70576/g.147825  ORF Transcript_70576/g.147825 Transcript_70576/m.147825 type:complete len:84 (-) Transcript_70576:8-259(-)